MKITQTDAIPYQRFSAHRPGNSQNKRLLSGTPGQADNFELSLVLSAPDYRTPRHRHNFDQIRYMVEGDFGYGSKRQQGEGSLSYFPEGVSYAQQAIGESVTLLLQFGGACGQGFISYEELERGYGELLDIGEFVDGAYLWRDEHKTRHSRDAYEAIWEHVRGRRIIYPKPRYDAPILMRPEHFSWIRQTREPGVEIKVCGRFSERDVGMGLIRMAFESQHVVSKSRLLYALEGEGALDGQGWAAPAALDPEGQAGLVLKAASASQLVFFDRPDFSFEAAVTAATK